ncbi:expressed unknown protein [Seminavis robusta]|uniref:Uncharacterized protein n=1 Tax=Seminavis robusta TaxID=568900 RepID=A0A9N8E637_9STRA|nr:expressed unknown protein [Seminavis robusta]|eukprot:Sro554_g165570.1 n/a (517) ;mRNA; r:46141-48126
MIVSFRCCFLQVLFLAAVVSWHCCLASSTLRGGAATVVDKEESTTTSTSTGSTVSRELLTQFEIIPKEDPNSFQAFAAVHGGKEEPVHAQEDINKEEESKDEEWKEDVGAFEQPKPPEETAEDKPKPPEDNETAETEKEVEKEPEKEEPATGSTARTGSDIPIGPFQLKLHWTPRSCWNDDCETEQHWCMQCEGFYCNWGDIVWVEPCRPDRPPQQLFYWIPIPLIYVGGADAVVVDTSTIARQQPPEEEDIEEEEEGTPHYFPGQAHGSRTWGQLQMRTKEWWPTGFGDGSFYQVNVFLCLERWATRRYFLAYCSFERHQQWFHGMDPTQPFELYAPPLLDTTSNANDEPEPPVPRTDKCVKMHHHPRKFEEIIHTTCEQAREVRTNMWETVMGASAQEEVVDTTTTTTDTLMTTLENGTVIESAMEQQPEEEESDNFETFDPQEYYRLGDARRDPRCRPDAQCGVCEGHCRNNDECAGSLECFERDRNNPDETPPGCFGPGVPRMDYCYARPGN